MPDAIRLGLIGAGRWGQVYLETIARLDGRCRLTHLCTSHPERSAAVAYPVTVSARWEDLVRSDCQAVIIAAPPEQHAAMLEACLSAGKPCLVEKPLCMDVESAQRLERAVAESGVPVLVDHTQLFHPAYRRLKGLLKEGGEMVRFVLSEGMALGPFRAHSPALWDWAPHDVSLCLDLLGGAPRSVAALGCGLRADEAPDLAAIRLEFAGGASAWIQTGRLSPQKRRLLHAFTQRTLYRIDDLSWPSLVRAPIDLARYAEGGLPRDLAWEPVACETRPPMDAMLDYFLSGLSGGERSAFGVELAGRVVRVLAECEREVGS